MKFILKTIVVSFFIITFNSCNSDTKDDRNTVINGHWKLTAQINNNKTSDDNIVVLFEFDGDYLNVYVEESNNVDLTEKYPASYSDNELTLYNPDNINEIISVIELDDNNNFSNAIFEDGTIEISNNKTNYFMCRACYAACYVTHEALGISSLDWLCCFYLDC